MSQVYKMMVLLTTLAFLLNFAGLPSGIDVFLDWMDLSNGATGFSLSSYFDSLGEILTLSGLVTGLVVGFLVKSSPESAIVSPLATTLLATTANSFIALVNYTSGLGYVYYIVYLIFVPLLAGSGISIIKFWRGSD